MRSPPSRNVNHLHRAFEDIVLDPHNLRLFSDERRVAQQRHVLSNAVLGPTTKDELAVGPLPSPQREDGQHSRSQHLAVFRILNPFALRGVFGPRKQYVLHIRVVEMRHAAICLASSLISNCALVSIISNLN